MAAYAHMVQYARLHLRLLPQWLASAYSLSRHHLDLVLTVLPQVLGSLSWWKEPSSVMGEVPFATPQPVVTVVTDASVLRWGSHLSNLMTQGLWSPEELPLHINISEH